MFASAKYFFLWPFKVYVWRQGKTFTFSSWILQGDISLSWKTQWWHFCVQSLPLWEAAGCLLLLPWAPALTSQPSQDSILSQQWCPQESGASCRESFSLLKKAKQFPEAVTHREFGRVAAAQKVSRKGLQSEGTDHMGSRDPPATSYSWQHKTWPQPPFPHPHWSCNSSQSSFTLLFIFVPFPGTWFQSALCALVSPPVFPRNALLCFIFKPDHHFLFSHCFNTLAQDSQTQNWLCATALPYPRTNCTAQHGAVVPHARERRDPDRHLSLPSPPWQVAASWKHPVSQWIPLALVIQSCVICSCRRALPFSPPPRAVLQMA